MPDPTPVPVPPVNARAHKDLHEIVSASIQGHDLVAAHLVALLDHPRTVVAAAVNEMVGLITGLAARQPGQTPEALWAEICRTMSPMLDAGDSTPPPNSG